MCEYDSKRRGEGASQREGVDGSQIGISQDERLVRLFEPRSIAVVGASEDRGKFGGRLIRNLVRHGFPGDIIPINPARAEVLGRRCFPRILEAGRSIDVAVLAVPPRAVPASIEDCADAGVGGCVIITTGFAEEDAKGATAQAEIERIARLRGMRLLGPNCMGFIDFRGRVALSSALALGELPLVDGPIALVTQSGGLMTSMFAWAVEQGIGLSFCASTGNESDVDLSEILEYLSYRRDCKAVCVYAERIGHPLRFLRAARRCIDERIGVLLLKSGRTASGAVAARSHTASIVGSFDVIAANCKSAGIVLADDPKAMIHAAALYAQYGCLQSRGQINSEPAVGVVSGSGGALTVLADRLSEGGIPLAAISSTRPMIVGRSAGFVEGPALFDTGRRENGLSERSATFELIGYLAGLANVDAIVIAVTGGAGADELVDALVECSRSAKKPILCCAVLGGVPAELRTAIASIHLALFDNVDEIIRVVRLWSQLLSQVTHGSSAGDDRTEEFVRANAEPESDSSKSTLQLLAHKLHEATESSFALTTLKDLLRDLGLPANRSTPAHSEDEAIERALEISYPVALKISARDVVHKQQIGGVALGLKDGPEVREAWKRIVGRAVAQGIAVEGCTVEQMAQGEVELLLGIRWADDWPGVILIAEGGVSTDVERARCWLSAAATKHLSEIEAAVRVLPVWRRAFNGRLATAEQKSIRSVAAIVQTLGQMASDLTGLHEHGFVLEVNPVLVAAESGVATILDVHVVAG